MKKVFVTLVAVSAVVFAVAVSNNNQEDEMSLLKANVEALADGESESYTGALWSNPSGTRYCCGSGNVRDCSKTDVPPCK